MHDPTEALRRQEVAEINADPGEPGGPRSEARAGVVYTRAWG